MRLTKRDVEALLAAVDDPPDGIAEEIDGLVEVLSPALARVLDAPAGTPWPALVDRAGTVAGWPPERTGMLRGAVTVVPAQAEAVRDALWDLLAELNERRSLAP